MDGGRLAGGNLPELGESAKVVETDVVAGLRGPAEALQPPAIACGAKRVPVVERIPPALASGAEVIGRHARDDFGKEIAFAQAEQITVRPHVRALIVHKNRDVTDDADRFLRTIILQRTPLLPEEELDRAAPREICGQVTTN